MTSSLSIRVAQWSTVAIVRPRSRPPRSITVTLGTSARAPAARSEEVTTVSLLPGRIVVAIASATS